MAEVSAQLVCVYRERNAKHVLRLALAAQAQGWPVALWALDEEAVALRPWTVGVGRGLKLSLTNQLIDLDHPGYVIVADDDIAIRRSALPRLVRLIRQGGIDLGQPGHALLSWATWRSTRSRPMHRARRVTFVEIGPLFVMGPRARVLLLPLPEDMGMGWGLELIWRDTCISQGLRMGVIDGVRMHHLKKPQGDYATHDEHVRLNAMVAERALTSMLDAQATTGRWWAWQRKAPWTA